MSKDDLLEEDIWEYKSIRKITSISYDLESISQNVQNSNDGKDKSQRGGNERASKERETSKKTKQGQRKRRSKATLKPEQQCSVPNDDPIPESQEGVPSTSAKPKKSCKKQSPSKPRPVYEGYCPSCQMPFSLLLIQTPQWHVTECLDGKSTAEKGTRPQTRKRKAKGSVEDSDGIPESSGRNTTPGGQRRWRKKFKESCPDEEGTRKKQCPFYKKIPGTSFVVDAFQYGEIEGCKGYFLTHFHSDHYGGLTKKFTFPIYCNKITGNLVKSKLRVLEEYIHILPMNTECIIDGIKVVLLDANHCPGAAMILFAFPNGTAILHTGDFRAHPSMERYPFLIGRKINTLYLDTTYCSPEYTFPSQQEMIQFAANTAFEIVTLNPRTLVVCGTYSIGKEKVFLAIANVLGSKVSMSQEKYKTLQCLESTEINSLITLDWNNTLLHLLPMMQINFKGLQNHLSKFSAKFDQILAFKPTGWTYSDQCYSLNDIQPQTRGNITIYGIPYSEHSSFVEMKRFVQWLKPQKIIPTVNVGNWKTRNEMEKHFRDWKMDTPGWN
ncbi:DNA cross-link repair 1A protein isoform X2 [Anolis carolinensis]|uniref:DNA cross-link repair 1A protein isoform X2 n=1 Tax=Anolis carolinensis TaxID=28377 RepID=UPI002F2B51DC